MLDTTWLDESSDIEEAYQLTAMLVSYKSYPGLEGPVQRAIAAWFEAEGIPVELQETEGDRPNVIVRIENGPGPVLLLNGHVDTVLEAQGWKCDPWKGQREGNMFYGLGAADMKSGVAAMMLAVRALHRRRDLWKGTLIATSVVDEEAFSIGARAIVDMGIKADACIVTEPSWDKPVIGGVGKVLVRADITGKSSHGSMPEEGINAAVEAARLVAKLDSMPLGQHPRMKSSQAVLSFHSGSDQYVITVPEKARFTINRHTVFGETDESVLAEMRELADSLNSPARFDFAIDPPYYPPWELSPDHPILGIFEKAFKIEVGKDPDYSYATFVADSNYFSSDANIPTFIFGPKGYGYHQCNESVDLSTIAGTVRVLLRFATEFMPA